MSEVKRNIEAWIESKGLKNKYIIETKRDSLMGEMLLLFSVYSNGTKQLQIETNSEELIKDTIKEREHI